MLHQIIIFLLLFYIVLLSGFFFTQILQRFFVESLIRNYEKRNQKIKLTSIKCTVSINSGLRNLTYLNLSDNSIMFLPRGRMENLKFFDVSKNLVKVLDKPLSNLRQLHASHNNLQRITENVLKMATDLQYLDLSYNSLTDVPWQIFTGKRKLIELHLSGNRLENWLINKNGAALLSGLHSLRILEIQHCNLINSTAVQKWLPAKLNELDLSFNSLAEIPDISRLSDLHTLIIRNNSIKTVSTANLQAVKNLDIDMSGNPFLCRCDILKLVAWIRKRNRLQNEREYKCNAPRRLLGVRLTQIDAEKVGCRKSNVALAIGILCGSVLIVLVLLICTICRQHSFLKSRNRYRAMACIVGRSDRIPR